MVRAVLLSDTNPPLYYLLLYGWTLIFGDERYGAPIIFNGMFARLPASARHDRAAYRWTGSGAGSLRSFCLLTADDLLFGRRTHVLALVAVRACDHLDLVRDAAATRRRWPLRALDPDVGAGFLTHYFFVFPWLAIVAYLVARPGSSSDFIWRYVCSRRLC